MLACYTDRLSVSPGGRFRLHASAETGEYMERAKD